MGGGVVFAGGQVLAAASPLVASVDARGRLLMASDHVHVLKDCPECEGGEKGPCIYCDNRRYFEFCAICREPMGKARRKWKRERAANLTLEREEAPASPVGDREAGA